MIWRRSDHVMPYGLSRLDKARAAGAIILVEGESDAWICWFVGMPALGLPGASTWKEEFRRYLQDISTVYVWRELDRGGDSLMAAVTADLPDVRIIEPPAGLKDLNELWHAVGYDKDQFFSRLGAMLSEARPASQLRGEAIGTEARELLESCRSLLEDPRLLDRVRAAITASGYAGDTTAPTLSYLGITSRLLERPLNLAFVAQSGAGKNAAVDASLVLMPDDAYFLEKAGSARALIYSEASFAHIIVIVSEADSIPQDEGAAASAIRSLAEDGYMTYNVVVTDPETGLFVTRRITKLGPTGLFTTSTRPLKEQMSTRTFTVPINDSPDQTREVMRAHAASVNGHRPEMDVGIFIDMQRWLALAGDHQVTIPYSRALADLVPSTHVRMRRDFRQLLTLIQAVALLYQRQRPRDAQGRIVANLDDYAIARELVLTVFTAAASGGVTPLVRQTVEGLQKLYAETAAPVTRKGLGDSLGLATDTVWHRVQRALELGYIVNLETRPRQPAKLVPGEVLPEDVPALPTAEELCSHMCGAAPENDSIVQSEPPAQTQTESEPVIESGIESAIHTDVQSLSETGLDSETQASLEPIERLNGKSEDLHTSLREDEQLFDDAESDLIYCPGFDGQGCDEVISTGEGYCPRHLLGLVLVSLGHAHWPRLKLSDGNTVEGDDNWRRWLREAGPTQTREVLATLRHEKRGRR